MEVVSSPEQGPEQGLLRPRTSGELDSGQLPAVIVVAPTTVAYTVPDAHAEAEFIYSLAIHAGDFRGSGRVTFIGTLDGAPLFEHVLDCSRTVPAALGSRQPHPPVRAGEGACLCLPGAFA